MKAGNTMDDNFFMQEAINLATEHMLNGDGGPFGAVIVKDEKIIAKGWNRVTSSNDPTAHAEIDCIRKACKTLNNFELTGCTLYASCEPCPMCLSAAYWAQIKKICYGAGQQDAAAAGFNDAFIYSELHKEPDKRKMVMQQLKRNEALKSFDLWNVLEDKITY